MLNYAREWRAGAVESHHWGNAMAIATELTAGACEESVPLEGGECLDQKTFHTRYERMPGRVKAELIGGKVYIMASPLWLPHGRAHARIISWLGNYQGATIGTDLLDNTTAILGDDCEPQPDAMLLILPEFGGQTREGPGGWLEGGPELVVEVAASSQAYDLREKRVDYERYGVKEYVVYAIGPQRVYWWVRRGQRFEDLIPGSDRIFRSEIFPGLWLDPTALPEPNSSRLHAVLQQGLASPEHAAFVAQLEAARK
jgi:Uma2 family endonuclease